MSSRHLSKGSELPPKTSDKLRLYSMRFCPYVQRVRMVLVAKKIPFEIVNVDLVNKPEWLFELNPQGKVPILDIGTRLISESLDISNYLEKAYPEPALDTTDEATKNRNAQLLQEFDKAAVIYHKAARNTENKEFGAYLEDAKPYIKIFEEELTKRGDFFHGSKPGMFDFMIWPWVERLPSVNVYHNIDLQIPDEYSKNLKLWAARMLQEEAVQESFVDATRHAKLRELMLNRESKINIDDI